MRVASKPAGVARWVAWTQSIRHTVPHPHPALHTSQASITSSSWLSTRRQPDHTRTVVGTCAELGHRSDVCNDRTCDLSRIFLNYLIFIKKIQHIFFCMLQRQSPAINKSLTSFQWGCSTNLECNYLNYQQLTSVSSFKHHLRTFHFAAAFHSTSGVTGDCACPWFCQFDRHFVQVIEMLTMTMRPRGQMKFSAGRANPVKLKPIFLNEGLYKILKRASIVQQAWKPSQSGRQNSRCSSAGTLQMLVEAQ